MLIICFSENDGSYREFFDLTMVYGNVDNNELFYFSITIV